MNIVAKMTEINHRIKLGFIRMRRIPTVNEMNNYKANVDSDYKEIERGIVARYSSGNARLKQGRYITQKEIDERMDRFLNRKNS